MHNTLCINTEEGSSLEFLLGWLRLRLWWRLRFVNCQINAEEGKTQEYLCFGTWKIELSLSFGSWDDAPKIWKIDRGSRLGKLNRGHKGLLTTNAIWTDGSSTLPGLYIFRIRHKSYLDLPFIFFPWLHIELSLNCTDMWQSWTRKLRWKFFSQILHRKSFSNWSEC